MSLDQGPRDETLIRRDRSANSAPRPSLRSRASGEGVPKQGLGTRRIDRATISLLPRSTADCLDMAVMFFGRHLRTILGLCLAFMVPAGALVYGLSYVYEIDVRVALIVAFLATSPLGVLLVSRTAAGAFGGPSPPAPLAEGEGNGVRTGGVPHMKTLLGLLNSAMFLRGFLAVGPTLCLFPVNPGMVLIGVLMGLIGLWAAMRFGFRAEQVCLADLEDGSKQHRTTSLIREEAGDLMFRAGSIGLFCLGLWLAMFVTLDLVAHLLFGFPIFLGRVFAGPDGMFSDGYFVELMVYDPLVLTAVTVTGFPVYALGRLAWFFCYIDLRVRRDCWDMELEFAQEAQRLQGAA